MKKKLYSIILALVFVMAGVIGLTACGDDGKDGPSTTTKQSAVDISGKTFVFSDVKMIYTNDEMFMDGYVPNPNGREIKSPTGLSEYAAKAYDNMAALKALNAGKKVIAVETAENSSKGKLRGDFSMGIGNPPQTFDDVFLTDEDEYEWTNPYYYEYSTEKYYSKYYTVFMYSYSHFEGFEESNYWRTAETYGNLRGKTLTMVYANVARDPDQSATHSYAYVLTFMLEETAA
ncbi:MAG: hypothetical protein J1G38_07055 [Clostridiales bacterium]|nr:hypothetical protein [Clostridiales bacterium]